MKHIEKHRNSPISSNETVEVLYQKLGDRWFAFSLIEGEVFFGSISPEEIQKREEQKKAESLRKRYKEFQ